jgi:hypothetical protein
METGAALKNKLLAVACRYFVDVPGLAATAA